MYYDVFYGSKEISDEKMEEVLSILRAHVEISVANKSKEAISRKEMIKASGKKMIKEIDSGEDKKMDGNNNRKDSVLEKFTFGVNAVTRAMERQEVSLVVVAKSDVPPIMIAHLPLLSFKFKVPMIVLPCSSVVLGKLFGFRTLITFAVRINQDFVSQLINFSKVADVPWLQSGSECLSKESILYIPANSFELETTPNPNKKQKK